jgi:2-polyprenyl-6-methoxyphenol hydroxylase-like FAD-dependent oxidoreductase
MTRALVIGASMSGLLAAQVLSRHFGEVEIVERDRLPDGPEFRNGVPQSRHAHVLLRAGLDALENLFPGFATELREAGAVPVEPPREMPWLNAAGWSGRFGVDLGFLSSSRELTESLVRNRVKAAPNVTFRTRTEVVGLMNGKGRVTGVRVRTRDGSRPDSRQAAEVLADLVVDASGRMSRIPEWLGEMGYDRPREVIINSHLAYASRIFRRPSRILDWKGLLIGATPDVPRGAAVVPLEGDRWIVGLAGYGRASRPPIDEAGYNEFLRSLRSPILFHALQGAEPLSPIYGYARTENVRRHYELLTRRPEGLVVIGDATCCFNPIYGQGMSVAGLSAQALDRSLLRSSENGIAASAQRAIGRVSDDAWLLATGEDLRYATTEGGPGAVRPLERAVQRYLNRVILRSNQDVVVSRALTRVIHLLDPPRALFRPGVIARVFIRRSTVAGSEPQT